MTAPSSTPWCGVCQKTTGVECSHVDCANRKRVTAQAIGSHVFTSGRDKDGRNLNGEALARKPRYFED